MDNFIDELMEDLNGSIAMDSVVLNRINLTAKKYDNPEFDTYSDALELIEKHGGECAECPECGWISEGNFYEHPDHDGVCSDCEVAEEY